MTTINDALNWVRSTKESVKDWPFGNNISTVKKYIAKNRDAKAITDSYHYQIDMVLHQAKTNEAREMITTEYDQLQSLLEKRRSCLELIGDVTKMEDLFSALNYDVNETALQLSSKSQGHLNHSKVNSLLPLQQISLNCMKSLKESWEYLQSLAKCNHIHLQNASAYHQFWHEVEESNDCLQYLLSQVPSKFSARHFAEGRSSLEIKHSLDEMMKTLSEYLQWQTRVDILYEKAKHIVPLPARTSTLKEPLTVQVLADYKTDEFKLSEGDFVLLMDNSDKKKWKVRISEEHLMKSSYSDTVQVPAILLLIPPTEPAALDASLRLRLQMLAIFSATTQQLGKHVTKLLLHVFREWDETQKEKSKSISSEQRQSLMSLIGFMQETLGITMQGDKTYEELIKKTTQLANHCTQYEMSADDKNRFTIIVQINYIHKLLRRFWDFQTYYEAYRTVLEDMRQPMNIFIYNNRTQMRYITKAHFVKYWDCDLEDRKNWAVETEEGFLQADQVDSLQSAQAEMEEEEEMYDSATTEQRTETEQVMESEMEVETTFVITGVVKNPGEEPEVIISLQEAIDTGVIHPASGLYVNRRKRITVPIPQAMNEGLIKMGPKQEKKSEEKVKSAGIVTVRTTRETRPYTVIQALNTSTGFMLPAEVAINRGILNPENNTFKDLEKGNIMLIGDAVQHKYVEIEYDPIDTNKSSNGKTKPVMLEEISVTYLVHAVVDQRTKTRLAFHEAVQKGIIDRDTGAYIDNVTGEKYFVVDAINKGYVKATVSDKPPSLQIGQLGNMAVNEQFKTIKKRILNPLKALAAMKYSANINNNTISNGTKTNGY